MAAPGTLADLARQIMSTPPGEPAAAVKPPAPVRRPLSRRRLLLGLPVAAALAVALLVATSLGRPGQHVGPFRLGPPGASAAALSFTRHGGYLDVIVRNPVADPATYRAEFAAHHLRITLQLVPASPSVVGTLVYGGTSSGSGGITTITARGRCWTGGGGNVCPVGVRVPAGYRGTADFAFGRAARPGEQYETTGLVTAPGEAMHGLRYQGRTVAAVLAMLSPRHVSVPRYRYLSGNGVTCRPLPSRIPGTWRVYQADPWAAHQVVLFVGPAASAPGKQCAGPPVHSPRPSPTASAGAR